jgi:hypothetical protein
MSSPLDLQASIERARKRLAGPPGTGRKKRSDLGSFRIKPRVAARLRTLLSGHDHPGINAILSDLKQYCAENDLPCPSRATVYNFVQKDRGPSYAVAGLPAPVRAALYNLPAEGQVPGAQLAFYCFNYGSLAALHYAASMPWLPLYQAYRMRGWRQKSRGLLRAVLVTRGISRG